MIRHPKRWFVLRAESMAAPIGYAKRATARDQATAMARLLGGTVYVLEAVEVITVESVRVEPCGVDEPERPEPLESRG